jgi:hypothetical protein
MIHLPYDWKQQVTTRKNKNRWDAYKVLKKKQEIDTALSKLGVPVKYMNFGPNLRHLLLTDTLP